MHPDGRAHGGSAIIIKHNIRHHETMSYKTPEIQATNIVIEDWLGHLVVSGLYSPPKHVIKKEDYVHFFKTLGPRFIAGGDYNSKHINWGSRLTTPKGRQLQAAINDQKLNTISSGEPTYWPTDPRKIPDLVDFYIIKGISATNIKCTTNQDLSSDHGVVIMEVNQKPIYVEPPLRLHGWKTDWDHFRSLVESGINMKLSLKTEEEVMMAVEHFNQCVQNAAWYSTPPGSGNHPLMQNCSKTIRELVYEKRQARKRWQTTRFHGDKTKLNYLTNKLKNLLTIERNENVQYHLRSLDATANTEYSLWKTTKKLKRPVTSKPPIRTEEGTWAKSDLDKGEAFATYLDNVFLPNPDQFSSSANKDERLKSLEEPLQLDLPIKAIKQTETVATIKNLNQKKAPGYDSITAKLLQELPDVAISFLTHLFNCVMKRSLFPPQWKVAEIIMIPKPGKPPQQTASYRPISLLPILSKVMETLFLKRLNTEIVRNNIIPNHQFGFRVQHGTIEQVHRLVEEIHKAYDSKKYCCAAFLDISQAFDRVWHDGLLSKIKNLLPANYYSFIKSYLSDRFFYVKQGEHSTQLHSINAGVPQGSVLGPTLYLLFTSDLPATEGVIIGTFADDTAALAVHEDPIRASNILQSCLNNITEWLTTWRIKANESKSIQVTFTVRHQICPPVTLNQTQIPQEREAKYLGLYLDTRLTWKKHIFTKRKALGMQLRKMYWLLNTNSQLSLENKLLLYKCILKPIWTYGIQLWGTASNSNIEIIQRFQSKMLRMITKAPWFVTNQQLHHDLRIRTVKEEIQHSMKGYKERLNVHPNILANQLMGDNSKFKRLKRKTPGDL